MTAPVSEPWDAREMDQPTRRVRHDRERSEMHRQPDGSLLFRARCSCGWSSELEDIARTFLVWDDHWQNRRA